MTDVLPGVSATLDEELTSIRETPPSEPKTAADATTCHYCSQVFEGPARWFTRGRHEKDKHREEWLAAKSGTKPKAKAPKKPATPRAPKASATSTARTKRIPAAESIARNLGRVAKMLGSADPALSRALTFSAPATGLAVDELVAGTFVDRVAIQRFAGVADKWERLGGVIAFPILVTVIARNPALYAPLEDDLRDATLDVLIASIPTFEKRAAREKKAVDALRRLGQVDERYATSDDPIGLILRDIFAPVPPSPESDGVAE